MTTATAPVGVARNGDDMVTIGNLDIDIAVDGQTTRVLMRLSNTAGEEVLGYGEARCRKDDRFNLEAGADIAGGRALMVLGAELEKLGLGESKTETAARQGELADAIRTIQQLNQEGFELLREAVLNLTA